MRRECEEQTNERAGCLATGVCVCVCVCVISLEGETLSHHTVDASTVPPSGTIELTRFRF